MLLPVGEPRYPGFPPTPPDICQSSLLISSPWETPNDRPAGVLHPPPFGGEPHGYSAPLCKPLLLAPRGNLPAGRATQAPLERPCLPASHRSPTCPLAPPCAEEGAGCQLAGTMSAEPSRATCVRRGRVRNVSESRRLRAQTRDWAFPSGRG